MEINLPITSSELKRIIFLDIDGVVLPLSQPTRRRYEDCTSDKMPLPFQRLVALLDEHSAIALVLSSNWRVDYGVERARELLPTRHQQRLIGETPVVGSSANHGAECLRWLTEHGHAGPFATLDDCRQLFATNFKWLVPVNTRTGIDDESIHTLKQLLLLPT